MNAIPCTPVASQVPPADKHCNPQLTMEIAEPTIITVKPACNHGAPISPDSVALDCLSSVREPEIVTLQRCPAPPRSSGSDEGEPRQQGNGTVVTVAVSSPAEAGPVSSPQLDTEEVSRTLEWFRETLTSISKHGRVTLKDFKYAARECEVKHRSI